MVDEAWEWELPLAVHRCRLGRATADGRAVAAAAAACMLVVGGRVWCSLTESHSLGCGWKATFDAVERELLLLSWCYGLERRA